MTTTITRPRTNARGNPWTSAGRRNLTAAGTGLGNGGVRPPGHYTRRRDCLGPDRHDNRWRMDWLKLLAHLQAHGRVTPIDVSVGVAIATFSNDTGEHVWPSQTVIGERCGRSASVVGRSLAALRAHGLLEWEHRFNGPTHDNPLPSATSNLYEFRLPQDLLDEVGLRKRKRRSPARHLRHQPTPARDHERDQVMSMGAAQALLASSYEVGVAAVEHELAGRPAHLVLLAKEEYDVAWKRHRLRE
jgi:Helix-turn-helix domain